MSFLNSTGADCLQFTKQQLVYQVGEYLMFILLQVSKLYHQLTEFIATRYFQSHRKIRLGNFTFGGLRSIYPQLKYSCVCTKCAAVSFFCLIGFRLLLSRKGIWFKRQFVVRMDVGFWLDFFA